MNSIVFTKNKKKQLSRNIFNIVIGIGLLLLILKNSQNESTLYNITLISIISALTLYRISNIFIKKKSVVIDKNGISIKVNFMGLIEWKDIESVTITEEIKSYLTLNVKNPEEILKHKNILTKIVCRINQKAFGNSFIIKDSDINEPLNTALDKINNFKKSL